jgi:putative restriction endonuclease
VISNKQAYSDFVVGENLEGSKKAPSYIRALELLGPILLSYSHEFRQCSDVWSIHSVEEISHLYDYILRQQKRGESGIFSQVELPSYWKNGFYSAALKSYKEFLVLKGRVDRMAEYFDDPDTDAYGLSAALAAEDPDADEALAQDLELNLGTKEGVDALGKSKVRIHQNVFRKNIVKIYRGRCCITGLDVLPVLRASHIIAWSEDKANRLNPENGLCLAATYDAAFDRHLISVDENYRIILSPFLERHGGSEEAVHAFLELAGKAIELPLNYFPNQKFLSKHRSRLAE